MTFKLHTVLLHWGLGTILNFSGKNSKVQIKEYFHIWSWEKKKKKKLKMVQMFQNTHARKHSFCCSSSFILSKCFLTYGFILNRSRTATPAVASRLRMRSEKSLSFVQVMWTFSGTLSALSLMAACDAVFLSWMSWAWSGGKAEITQEALEKERSSWVYHCSVETLRFESPKQSYNDSHQEQILIQLILSWWKVGCVLNT